MALCGRACDVSKLECNIVAYCQQRWAPYATRCAGWKSRSSPRFFQTHTGARRGFLPYASGYPEFQPSSCSCAFRRIRAIVLARRVELQSRWLFKPACAVWASLLKKRIVGCLLVLRFQKGKEDIFTYTYIRGHGNFIYFIDSK